MPSMAFCAIDFSTRPWGWSEVTKRKKHYFFCQVHGQSTWIINGSTHQVPAGSGVWLPRGTTYSARFSAGDVICALGFRAKTSPASTPAAVIRVDAQLEDLLTRFSSPFTFRDDADSQQARIQTTIERIVSTPDDVRFPVSAAALAVAEAMLADPGSPLTVDGWAHWAHSSARSLQRAFLSETGLSFSAWRQRCRMAAARQYLLMGHTTRSVALRVGYGNHSALSRAYRAHHGNSPSHDRHTSRQQDQAHQRAVTR